MKADVPGPAEAAAPETVSAASAGRRPVRVLIVSDHLGGAGEASHGGTTYFLTVLPGFDRSRIEPTLCILRPRHAVADQFEAIGIRPVFLGRQKWDPRALTDLIRVVREHEIDVLHLIAMKGVLLGRIAARVTGRPAVIHLHDTLPMAPWLRFLQRRLAPWTGAALAVSQSVREMVINELRIPAERVEVLHNGLHIDRFANRPPGARRRIRRELGLGESTPAIGVIGRVTREPDKGHATLIRAMPAVLNQCPYATLLVVGDGPARGACESLVETLGLESAVRFTGQRDDIPDILAALDVVAMPSESEGLPYAALEATAAGRPVVAFRVGGVPEVVVHGETGLLEPKGNVAGLAEALAQVLNDPDLARRLGEGGRRHAQAFTVERHVRRLEEIYLVLGRRRPYADL